VINLNSVATLDIDAKRNQSLSIFINSPRSLEAFKRTGITPEELEPVNITLLKEQIAYKSPSRQVNPDIFKLRLMYANKARHKKLQLLKDVSLLKQIYSLDSRQYNL
jgi:hypothetical protein